MQGCGLAFFLLFAHDFFVRDAIDGEIKAFFCKTNGDIGNIPFGGKEYGCEICFVCDRRKCENRRGVMLDISGGGILSIAHKRLFG